MVQMNNTAVTPFGFNFAQNSKGQFSLTDMWREIGSPENKSLKKWLDLDSTRAFIDAASKILKVDKTDLLTVKRGKSGGTWGHQNILLEYAQYLDPKLAVELNELFFKIKEEESNPELSIERAKTNWRKQGKSEKWISMRIMSMEERKSFTHTLKEHGVSGVGYKNCTNAVYKHLWGGGADMIRAKKKLPDGANCRDFMSEKELAGVRLAEILAEENIQANNARGNKESEMYCEVASKSVATAILMNSSKKIYPNLK